MLYTTLDEAVWEVVATQQTISLLKATAIRGCPEDISSIRLSARGNCRATDYSVLVRSYIDTSN